MMKRCRAYLVVILIAATLLSACEVPPCPIVIPTEDTAVSPDSETYSSGSDESEGETGNTDAGETGNTYETDSKGGADGTYGSSSSESAEGTIADYDAGNTKYYAYSTLDDSDKAVYDCMYEAMRDLHKETIIPTTDETGLDKIFTCVNDDHPELFYVNGFKYVKYTLAGIVKKIVMQPAYTMDSDEVISKRSQIDEYVSKCLSGVPDGGDDYDKIKYIYEYLIQNTDYRLGAQNNQNICSVFITKESVCQGYSKATQYLLQKLGIEAVTVDGNANGVPHAWNVVKSDGNWYYLDTTWGDAEYQKKQGEASEASFDVINYDYLCVTGDDIMRTHTVDHKFSLPDCTANADNYYIREDLYFTGTDKDKLKDIFSKARQNGEKEVRFRCSDKNVYDEMYKYLITDQKIFGLIGQSGKTITYVNCPETYTYGFWIDE